MSLEFISKNKTSLPIAFDVLQRTDEISISIYLSTLSTCRTVFFLSSNSNDHIESYNSFCSINSHLYIENKRRCYLIFSSRYCDDTGTFHSFFCHFLLFFTFKLFTYAIATTAFVLFSWICYLSFLCVCARVCLVVFIVSFARHLCIYNSILCVHILLLTFFSSQTEHEQVKTKQKKIQSPNVKHIVSALIWYCSFVLLMVFPIFCVCVIRVGF